MKPFYFVFRSFHWSKVEFSSLRPSSEQIHDSKTKMSGVPPRWWSDMLVVGHFQNEYLCPNHSPLLVLSVTRISGLHSAQLTNFGLLQQRMAVQTHAPGYSSHIMTCYLQALLLFKLPPGSLNSMNYSKHLNGSSASLLSPPVENIFELLIEPITECLSTESLKLSVLIKDGCISHWDSESEFGVQVLLN